MDGDAGPLWVRLRQQAPIPLDVELACAPGELLALVGPSGSGKTTILRAIAGLRRPQYGRISCGGVTWLDTDAAIDLPPQRRSVGLVPQHYALFPHLTVAGNVRSALGHLPRGEQAARVEEMLALVHLGGLEQRRPGELSGGQQQRVALARALARDPAVLLLDEPFSAADQVMRRRLHRELVQLRAQVRVPILLVTHDLHEAAALADRMSVLHHGRTLQTGTPGEVVNRPRDAEVAHLVDQRNVFTGRVIGHRPETGWTFVHWRGRVLQAPLAVAFPPGAEVDWLVPPGSIFLHRRDRPVRADQENSVPGVIAEMVVLGDMAEVLLRVTGPGDDDEADLLTFSVPAHVAERSCLAVGEAVTVSPLPPAIHLMAPQPRRAGSGNDADPALPRPGRSLVPRLLRRGG
jgi:molybdate transport system ATP-binding protein